MDFEYFYGKQSSQYAFYRIPKQLFTESQFDALSIGAKLLYGMMIDRMELSQKNGWIDKHGRAYIYFTVDEVKNRFHCVNDKAVKLMKELDSDKGIGLIESVRQGLGKPNIIYVKNFVSGSQDVGKLYFAFLCAVNRVIHDTIACYAHFHDAREGFRIGLI